MVAAAYGEAAQRKAWKMCGLSLSGDWNVPIKAAFCPNRRTLFPNSRIWVQTVDEDGFPAYAEDTVKLIREQSVSGQRKKQLTIY